MDPWKRSGVTLVCDLKDVLFLFFTHFLVGGKTGKMRGHKPPFFRFSTSWKRPTTWSLPKGAADFGGPCWQHIYCPQKLPSGKLTWQWKITLLKMYSLLKMGIFHCYVSFFRRVTWPFKKWQVEGPERPFFLGGLVSAKKSHAAKQANWEKTNSWRNSDWVETSSLLSLKLSAEAPENGWLEDDPFLLGVCLFSGANC